MGLSSWVTVGRGLDCRSGLRWVAGGIVVLGYDRSRVGRRVLSPRKEEVVDGRVRIGTQVREDTCRNSPSEVRRGEGLCQLWH